ncbi:hypothetical protein AMELA_G00092860 [Ameiurus melas]|uniref:Uncharacterized protein n=1 Tax=Ameiurus melas TaxID=219545 RepID=A0A7J6AWL5_AMEME|nr:hypothetical protein AMELA_G00092860 [Ameiurus melas]
MSQCFLSQHTAWFCQGKIYSLSALASAAQPRRTQTLPQTNRSGFQCGLLKPAWLTGGSGGWNRCCSAFWSRELRRSGQVSAGITHSHALGGARRTLVALGVPKLCVDTLSAS